MMATWYFLVLLTTFIAPPIPERGDQGTLTLILRDAAGQPVLHVAVLVYRDADSGPPPLVAHILTDERGTVEVPKLCWGTYVVQFAGTLPDGRPVQPVAEQNARVVTDVGLGINGFGIRLAQENLTQLFVMGDTHAGPSEAAIPMFDLAHSTAEVPRPVDPQTGYELAVHVAQQLGEVGGTQASGQGALDPMSTVPTSHVPVSRWWFAGVLLLDLLLLLVWLRMMRRQRQKAER